MLKTLALLSLVFSFNTAGVPTRGKATVKTGRATTTASVRGKRVRVTTRQEGTTSLDMQLRLGAKCDAKKVAAVMAKEVSDNAELFRGPGGRGTLHVGLSQQEVRRVEQAMATILSSGRHQVGDRGGFTRFEGVDLRLGPLPPPGESKTIHNRDRRGGSSTVVASLPRGGVTVTHTRNGPGGVVDVLEVTFKPDGSSSMLRSLTFGSGENGVTISQGSERDNEGNETGGFAKVAKGSGSLFDGGVGGGSGSTHEQTGGGGGGSDSDQSSGGGGGGSESPTPSGGESGGDDNQEHSNAPSMTSDGNFHGPSFDLGDAFVGNVINWNRLGAAVTQPSPIGDDEVEPEAEGAGGGLTPCGQLEQQGFDPDPKYLRPNRQGWVTDPVPFLRGGSTRKRER